MSDQDFSKDDVLSKVVRAGRRTYFFDVKETKAGDYYLTITESKKFTNEDEPFYYKKHKIYLYKEDFDEFKQALSETMDFVVDKKGKDVISDKPRDKENGGKEDIRFEDI